MKRKPRLMLVIIYVLCFIIWTLLAVKSVIMGDGIGMCAVHIACAVCWGVCAASQIFRYRDGMKGKNVETKDTKDTKNTK